MARKKYIYNPQTLEYEEYKVSSSKRWSRFLLFVFTAGVIGYLAVTLIQNTIGTPKERMLTRENEFMKLQYEILSNKIDVVDGLLAEMQDRDDNIYRMIFEAEPIPTSIRKAGYGGTNRYEALEGYEFSGVVKDIAKRVDVIESQLYVQSKSLDEVYEMAKNKAQMLSCIPAIMPVKDVDIYRISSYYGYRTDPFYKVKKLHRGLDFSGPVGTHIYSSGDGVVESVVSGNSGYGNYIIINHGYGYKTRYAHLKKTHVKVGQKVKRGEYIADMGNSGKSTAPHLHYEVIKDGKAINPINFFFNDLTPEEYDKIIELSEQPSMTMD